MSNQPIKVVIIHGSYGSPDENWFPWLAGEVRKRGAIAVVPAFPTPQNQSLDTWRRAFAEQVGELTPNMILVGHSLGPGFILNLLEQSPVKVRGAFLASGFLGKLGREDFDKINESFVCRDFDWSKIRNHIGLVKVYNSDNDPYVPLSKGQELATELGTVLIVIKNGGHLNEAAGYREFQRLLDDLEPLLNARHSS